MGSRRVRLTLAAAAVAAAVFASCAWGASIDVLIRHTPNMTRTNRTSRTIDGIVIHATEGRFAGSIRWLEEARSRGSAHFVVSRRGQIVQLVPVTDVAWQAGNAWWNLHSIGIEHEGWTATGGFTEAEYRASAELVAYLAHRWGIPLDRTHVIGHDEVPNPDWPGHFGGVDGHRDPGTHWKWRHYMALVHFYAKHPVEPRFVHSMTLRASPPPPRPRRVAVPAPGRTETVVRATPLRATPLPAVRSVVARNATVHGLALWWSGVTAREEARRRISHVDFLVDGRLLYTDRTWPFAFNRTFGWNSDSVPNGWHLLVVRAYGAHGYRTRKLVPVHVRNAPIALRVSGVDPADTVAGTVRLRVSADAGLARVGLAVDGRPVSRDRRAPFELTWNTTAAAEGPHTLVVEARDRVGHRAVERLPVVVANAPSFPAVLAPPAALRDARAAAFALAD